MSQSHRWLLAAALTAVASISGSMWNKNATATASSESNSAASEETVADKTGQALAEGKPERKPELKPQPRLLSKPEDRPAGPPMPRPGMPPGGGPGHPPGGNFFPPPQGPHNGPGGNPPGMPPMGPPHAGGPGGGPAGGPAGGANPFGQGPFPGAGPAAGMGPLPGMGAMMGRGVDWRELQRTDPELYEAERQDMELERKTFELVGQFRQAPPDGREALKMAIQEAVAKHFEVRQKKRQLQLARMERDLRRMREEIERRDAAKDQIVGRRLKELIGEPGDLDF